MKRVLGVVCGVVLLATMAVASPGDVSTGFEQITVGTTAVGLTTSMYDLTNADLGFRTKRVTCTLATAAVNYRLDGTNPTASVGDPLATGERITLDTPWAIEHFRAIRTGGSSGVLNCHYWR